MSLTDAVSSTLSTVYNNIIVVVNDDNVSRNSENLYDDGGGHSKAISTNSTAEVTSVTTQPTEPDPLDSLGVAFGVSQGKLITVMCMLVAFSIFGSLGNGLVLYVFTKKNDKVTSTIFILALAWTDFFTCLVIMPFTVANIKLDSHLYLDFLCKAYQFLITSNVPLSAFIMVAIAVDRYFSICHPFMRVVTPSRARVSIICLVIVACALGSITACIYGVFQASSTDSNMLANTSSCCNETLNSSFAITTVGAPSQTLDQDLDTESASSSLSSSSLFATKNVEVLIPNSSFQEPAANTTEGKDTPSGEHPHSRKSSSTDGLCLPNELIFSERFTELYQKIYISFYIVSLLAVFTLYFFIYRSVAERREWRRKQKSWSHAPMAVSSVVTAQDGDKKTEYTKDGEHLELVPQHRSNNASNSNSRENGSGSDKEAAGDNMAADFKSKSGPEVKALINNCSHENGVDNSAAERKTNRERRDFNFLANIRTALMLFVVTLVFIISFLPAWLMATWLIEFEIIIFYMHFVYNVANPVIYAFMNQSFRKELKRVFQRGTHLLRGG